MGSGDTEAVGKIIGRTMESQSFNWQVEEELIKKTENEGPS